MVDEAPKRTLGFLLNDVARRMRKRFEQRARRLGLTRAQWQVLANLSRNEGIQQSGLAELLDVEPITLVRILDRLQAAGMIERRAHPADRRAWQLYLTPQAQPVLREIRAIGATVREEALTGIPDATRELLLDTLEAIKENLLTLPPIDDEEVAEARHG